MRLLKIGNKTISTPIIDILKSIRNQLTNGKLRDIRPRGNNIRVTCPFHSNGLEKTAASDIYIGDDEDIEYGFFRCFVCNCKGPFYHFVAECFDATDEWAKEWLIDNFSDGIIEYQIDLPEIILDKNSKKVNYLDENCLTNFESFHPYMIKRKLTQKVIDTFEIKYDPKSRSLVFPVRDETGKLLMLTRRSVDNKNFLIDNDKEKPLYLLYYILQHNIKEFLITEAQIDCLTSWGYGFPAVATIGNPSNHQLELLNKSGVRVLYLAFDQDQAGERFKNTVISKLRKDIIIIPVQFPEGYKDINDLENRDQFYDCIEKAEKNI